MKASQGEGELGTLIVVVLKAKNLPDKHSFYKQDPFAIIRLPFIGFEQTTKVDHRGGQHPLWDDEFHIDLPSTFTSVTSKGKAAAGDKEDDPKKLKIVVYAKEHKKDELIGEGEVDLQGTLKTGEFDDWVTLKTDGSDYRGEVYLEMTFYKAGPPPSPPASTAKLSSSPRSSNAQPPLSPHQPQTYPRPNNQTPIQQPSTVQQPQLQSQSPYHYYRQSQAQPNPHAALAPAQQPNQYLSTGANIQRRPSKLRPSERLYRAPPGLWVPPPSIPEDAEVGLPQGQAAYPPQHHSPVPQPPPKDTSTRYNTGQGDGSSLLVPPSRSNPSGASHLGTSEPIRIPSVLRPTNIKSSPIPIPASRIPANASSPIRSGHVSPHSVPILMPVPYASEGSPRRVPPALPPRSAPHFPGAYDGDEVDGDGEEDLPDPYLVAKYSKPAPLPVRQELHPNTHANASASASAISNKAKTKQDQEAADLEYARRLAEEDGGFEHRSDAATEKETKNQLDTREVELQKEREDQRKRQEEAERRLAEKRRQEEADEEIARRLEKELNTSES